MKVGAQASKFGFYKLIQKSCHGVKQNAKVCAIVKQNVIKLEVLILGGQRIDEEKEGMVEGEKREG